MKRESSQKKTPTLLVVLQQGMTPVLVGGLPFVAVAVTEGGDVLDKARYVASRLGGHHTVQVVHVEPHRVVTFSGEAGPMAALVPDTLGEVWQVAIPRGLPSVK